MQSIARNQSMSKQSTSPNIQPWGITPDQEKSIQATNATFEWLCRQSGEFFRPYGGKWIAAKDCRIIAVGETMGDLLSQLGQADLQTVLMHRVERPGKVIY